MPVLADQLRRVPLFAGLTDRAFESIANIAVEQELAVGSRLAVEGEPGDVFYLLLDGHVSVTRSGSAIAELRAGDFLGEISLIDGRPRSATAIAASDVRVAAIDREAFGALMERHPAVRHGVLVALTDRIRSDEAAALD